MMGGWSMKKCLALLKKITIKELHAWKDSPLEELPEKVSAFLYYMRLEFSLIAPIGLDPLKLADNLNECIYFVKKSNPRAFDDTTKEKIELISDICFAFKGQIAATLGDTSLEYQVQRENEIKFVELHQAIETAIQIEQEDAQSTLSRSEEILIEIRVKNIIAALKQDNLHAATQAFMDFGQFLLLNYPGYRLEQIQKELSSLAIFRESVLPPLHIIGQLSEARIRLIQEEVNGGSELNVDKVRALNGLKNSLTIVGNLLGGERVQEQLDKNGDVNEDVINDATAVISCCLPAQRNIRFNLQMLKNSLSKAQFSLTEKLSHLENKLAKLNRHGSNSESKRTAQRVGIVKSAIGYPDQPIVLQESFSSLICDIEDLISSKK